MAAEKIYNLRNIIRIPGGDNGSVHSKILGYYSRRTFDFTGGLSVREWLSTQSFESQLEFGKLLPTKDGWLFIPFK